MQKTALITGASSGIGEAFAYQLTKQMDHLVLVARRVERLKQVAEKITASGTKVDILVADLTEESGLQKVEQYIRDHPIHLLVNNAGFGLYGPVSETDPQAEQRMIQLNIQSSVRLTRAVLPQLLQRNEGGIIQVASVLSFVPSPYMAAYAATKSFVLAYNEALATEIRNTRVQISILCPGSTESEFAALAGYRQKQAMSADTVAAYALRQYEKGETVIIPGRFSQLVAQLPRVLTRNSLAQTIAYFFKNRR